MPPSNLEGELLVSSKPLTIYEAWNLALSACRTPLVMNLNLDDRLNIDAIELLENSIIEHDAGLVAGDWKICHSQEEANDVAKCFPAGSIPITPDWPPKIGTTTRIGSGTSHDVTYGPATMWQMSAHLGFPRYPYRTTDDYRIRGIADGVWWRILEEHLQKQMIRLPTIIGNYCSHPDTQAEFRVFNEWGRINNLTISPL